MSESSIGSRLTHIEMQLKFDPQRAHPTPPPLTLPPPSSRFGRNPAGNGSNRANLGLRLPTNTGPRRSESELKFQKIVEKSGMLKINGQIYQTTPNDLERVGEIGNGTSGHVVKMRHKPSEATIAVKQMRRTGNDVENMRIIMDLDVVLKSESCKYIVKCLGFFITDADVWICMELMTTCFDKLQKRTKMPVPEEILARVTVATVRALAYLKDKHNVIHRDVKPSNILIDDRGNIKLCDFGISGRLENSNAKTRSAGCAAYMAPERIDPAVQLYDIRADVWSLGITLVELATGVFPYRGCTNDFEVLTKVLTSSPPQLPDDQNFSPEFCDFVQRCLQKNYEQRPKYPDLLKHPFLQRAERDASVNVGEWFRNVAKSNDIPLTSPESITNVANAAGSSTEQPRVPTPLETVTEAVQAQSNQQKQTAIASSIPVKSSNLSNSNSIHNQQQSAGLIEQQQQQQQQLLQSKLSNITLASSQTTSSSPSYDPRSPSPAHHLQHQPLPPALPPPSTQVHHYLKLQPNSAIVSGSSNYTIISANNHNNHHSSSSNSNNTNNSAVNVGAEATRKYKHSPFLPRRTSGNDKLDYGSPKKESMLSSLGQSIFKNLPTSPFSQRKSEQKSYKPPPHGEDGGGGVSVGPIVINGGSNPGSPLLLNRKTIDLTEESQYKHLQGNTSPIVLQRFYHQQNQLREQQQQLEAQQTNPFFNHYPPNQMVPGQARCSPLPSHRTVHHPVNPALLNAGTSQYNSYLPTESSGIPVYQYPALNNNNNNNNSPKHKSGGFFNSFSRVKGTASNKVIDRGGEPGYADLVMYGGRQGLPEYGNVGGTIHGTSNGDGGKDDPGWLNSFADLAKKRFASFVKLNLNTSATGEKRMKEKQQQYQQQQQQQQQQLQHQQQYPQYAQHQHPHYQQHHHHQRDMPAAGAAIAGGYLHHHPGTAATNPFAQGGGIPSAISPPMAHVLSDRRHRSPDPPPRFNRGQSPLMLHRKLEQLGHSGSPILNRRLTSTSPSPPLPPRRGSESVPGSPQHLRTRINYTPEPHRRPYRTIDQ